MNVCCSCWFCGWIEMSVKEKGEFEGFFFCICWFSCFRSELRMMCVFGVDVGSCGELYEFYFVWWWRFGFVGLLCWVFWFGIVLWFVWRLGSFRLGLGLGWRCCWDDVYWVVWVVGWCWLIVWCCCLVKWCWCFLNVFKLCCFGRWSDCLLLGCVCWSFMFWSWRSLRWLGDWLGCCYWGDWWLRLIDWGMVVVCCSWLELCDWIGWCYRCWGCFVLVFDVGFCCSCCWCCFIRYWCLLFWVWIRLCCCRGFSCWWIDGWVVFVVWCIFCFFCGSFWVVCFGRVMCFFELFVCCWLFGGLVCSFCSWLLCGIGCFLGLFEWWYWLCCWVFSRCFWCWEFSLSLVDVWSWEWFCFCSRDWCLSFRYWCWWSFIFCLVEYVGRGSCSWFCCKFLRWYWLYCRRGSFWIWCSCFNGFVGVCLFIVGLVECSSDWCLSWGVFCCFLKCCKWLWYVGKCWLYWRWCVWYCFCYLSCWYVDLDWRFSGCWLWSDCVGRFWDFCLSCCCCCVVFEGMVCCSYGIGRCCLFWRML